jgi:glycosyltransferase involved in cell wall biosynthesis
MKILFLNSSDTNGGAAIAAYRLFVGLRNEGVTVKMLVRDKVTNDPDIISCLDFDRKGWIGKLDKLIWKIKNRIRKQKWKKYPNRESIFLNDLDSISLLRAIHSIEFDILHLHFVANRFLDLHELTKINKPIVWTLHDSWAFTGICHFFYDCKRYEESCGCCPMLHSDNPNDFTNQIWKIKNKIYKNCDLHIVTPSNWLGNCATKSSLFSGFPLSVIPNGISTQLYKPLPVTEARESLGLDADKHYLLFGAVHATSDSNKGFDLLIAALKQLKQIDNKQIELLVFGAERSSSDLNLGFPTTYMGIIRDENKLVQIYNSADVVIVPSRSENFSNTILESLSCGTPVVGFGIGGNSDLINHKLNGYLANSFDTHDLANGIIWCLENNSSNVLSVAAQKGVESEYNMWNSSNKYLFLYNKVVEY